MGMFMSFKATCPVDGTSFEYDSTPSFTIMGRRLDGCPYGSWRFPVEIPRCPTCRFPAVSNLVADDKVEAARALTASPEYAALAEEADYYALAFVMARLEVGGPLARIDKWMKACWETGPADARYGRYVRELADRLHAVPEAVRAEDAESWAVIDTFVANLQRQAGDFGGAVRRLDALEASGEADGLETLMTRTRALIADGDRSLQHGRDDERTHLTKRKPVISRRVWRLPPKDTN